MKKTFQFLVVSTFLVTSLQAGKTEEEENERKTLFQKYHQNLTTVIEQQKSILAQTTLLQKQFEESQKNILLQMKDLCSCYKELPSNFDTLIKLNECLLQQDIKDKEKKIRETVANRFQARITKAGDIAVAKEKRKWKSEKVNNYNVHREIINMEIKRATDEGNTRWGKEGATRYEPVEILVDNLLDSQWISIGDFRKQKNTVFDEKQKQKKKSIYEETRKKAELQEMKKIYNENIKELDSL